MKKSVLLILALVALFGATFGTPYNQSAPMVDSVSMYTTPIQDNRKAEHLTLPKDESMTHVLHVADCTAYKSSHPVYTSKNEWCESSLLMPVPVPVKVWRVRHSNDDSVSSDNPTITIEEGGAQIPGTGHSCKNKNSGKDGTPQECNAGKGQEKHN